MRSMFKGFSGGTLIALIIIVTLIVTGAVVGFKRGVTDASQPAQARTVSTVRGGDSYAIPKQIPVLCFHGIGTPSSVIGSVAYYNTTLANFTAEMKYLAANGYSSITPQQYANWQHGVRQLLPAKPILLTFDDAFVNDQKATSVLDQYGFHGVLFVVSGYADGLYGSQYAGWPVIEEMASQGWMIQLHAGKCGHAYMPYAPKSCSKGLDASLITPTDFQYYIWPFGQTAAKYHARVVNDITQGQQDIQQHLGLTPGWSSTVFAAPFGAWGNGDNPWLIKYWDSVFQTVFVQYIASSDQAVAHADGVRYRLELGYQEQSASYLASHLSNAAFTLAGAGSGVTTGVLANNSRSAG